MKSLKKIIENSFITDNDLVDDFKSLTRKEFLSVHTNISKDEYHNTDLIYEFLDERLDISKVLEKGIERK